MRRRGASSCAGEAALSASSAISSQAALFTWPSGSKSATRSGTVTVTPGVSPDGSAGIFSGVKVAPTSLTNGSNSVGKRTGRPLWSVITQSMVASAITRPAPPKRRVRRRAITCRKPTRAVVPVMASLERGGSSMSRSTLRTTQPTPRDSYQARPYSSVSLCCQARS